LQCPNLQTIPQASAGAIGISGAPQPIELVPNGAMYSTFSTSAPFSAGASYTVVAKGGTIPPFSGSIVFPGAVSVLSPQFGGTLTIDTSVDLNISWSGSNGGPSDVVVTEIVEANGSGGNMPTLICSFSASLQMGTVPNPTLRSFKSEVSGGAVAMAVLSLTQNFENVGGWNIGFFGADLAAVAPITLQ